MVSRDPPSLLSCSRVSEKSLAVVKQTSATGRQPAVVAPARPGRDFREDFLLLSPCCLASSVKREVSIDGLSTVIYIQHVLEHSHNTFCLGWCMVGPKRCEQKINLAMLLSAFHPLWEGKKPQEATTSSCAGIHNRYQRRHFVPSYPAGSLQGVSRAIPLHRRTYTSKL